MTPDLTMKEHTHVEPVGHLDEKVVRLLLLKIEHGAGRDDSAGKRDIRSATSRTVVIRVERVNHSEL